MSGRLPVASILGELRDFQRRTVEYVFRRMYLDQDPARRFLVADEAGLGKTMVARGIIARVIQHLEKKGVERIDIIYVCSNAAIARQNLNRLDVYGNRLGTMATRLTLLPAYWHDLKENRINLISFTPGTSFDLKTRGGVMEERRVLYQMLRNGLRLPQTGILHLLQAAAGQRNWQEYAGKEISLNERLKQLFQKKLRQDQDLLAELRKAACAFHRGEESGKRYELISRLRQMLACICLKELRPHLVIFDEFQRFKDLLDGDDDAAQLAGHLLKRPEVRVLLLSATPYKMLTLHHDTGEDHYEDFRRTLAFLLENNEEKVNEVSRHLEKFRRALFGRGQVAEEDAEKARAAIENCLRRVMVRTERVAATEQSDAMVSEPAITAPLRPVDLKHAMLIDRVARALKTWDPIEYWKSSPYLLNVMKEYELKRLLRAQMKRPSEELLQALQRGREQLLRRSQFTQYREVDPANARLRSLMEATVKQGQWRLLWVPPSLPYWRPAGAIEDHRDMTKALVFSAWQMVPDAIAMFCSYEAERLMFAQEGKRRRHRKTRRRRWALLRFAASAGDRLAGMPLFCLLYPSIALAVEVDPLTISLACQKDGPPSLDWVRARVRKKIESMLRRTGCWPGPAEGKADQRWYWAALAILDAHCAPWMKAWCAPGDSDGWTQAREKARAEADSGSAGRAGDVDKESRSGFERHVKHFADFMRSPVQLGRAPDDLLDVLAEVALASPAVCALRSLRRVVRWVDLDERRLLNSAARISEGFRRMFNLPEVMALLRAEEGGLPYWRQVLEYCMQGNLPAVLDEYFHGLRESLGLVDKTPADAVDEIGETASEALAIKTSRLEVDQIRVSPKRGNILLAPFFLLSRFAMRYGDVRREESGILARAEAVQTAFNSPFRPFILATTSIGQEGLDFHPYCHAVYHWNLPSNPVDLEQREGRVHRYKGHAVRKNVALRLGLRELRRVYRDGDDPWARLFELAAASRSAGKDDLEPYWVYPVEGGSCVERRVPILPFSREQSRLPDLKASLAVYRLVFGQPRQEDLLSYLAKYPPADVDRWRISLSPPPLPANIASDVAVPGSSTKGNALYCRRCGEAVRHRCSGRRGTDLHWQTGDEAVFHYLTERNGGPQYCLGKVEAVKKNVAKVKFLYGTSTFHRCDGGRFWDSGAREYCQLVSHWDPSGGPVITLVCPKCGWNTFHSCQNPPPSSCHGFRRGQRIVVTYPPSDGMDVDTVEGVVVRGTGHVIRVYVEDPDSGEVILHLAQDGHGHWIHLECGLPCEVTRPEGSTKAEP